MSAKPDMSNPLIATPVAHLAATILPALTTVESVEKAVSRSIDLAEFLAGQLIERGHLPLTTETEEPKQGDAELILIAMLHGVAQWQFYGPGDPRGTLSIGLGPARYTHTTKLVKGVPHLSDAAREQLEQNISPFLRRL